jgi:hypothetical protein
VKILHAQGAQIDVGSPWRCNHQFQLIVHGLRPQVVDDGANGVV